MVDRFTGPALLRLAKAAGDAAGLATRSDAAVLCIDSSLEAWRQVNLDDTFVFLWAVAHLLMLCWLCGGKGLAAEAAARAAARAARTPGDGGAGRVGGTRMEAGTSAGVCGCVCALFFMLPAFMTVLLDEPFAAVAPAG